MPEENDKNNAQGNSNNSNDGNFSENSNSSNFTPGINNQEPGLHNPFETQEGVNPHAQHTNDAHEIPNPDPFDPATSKVDPYVLLKKVQNKALIGSICGACSVILGGVLLSSIGLAISFVGLVRANKLSGAGIDADLYKKVRIMTIVAICVCAVALVLNFATVAMLLPSVLEAMQTGDLSSLYGYSDLYDSSSAAPTSSTWG